MKRRSIIIASVCLTLCSCASADYVPDTGWSGFSNEANFYEAWIGKQLRAAGEPSFSDPENIAPYTSRFRLLVLPSFDPAFVFRFDRSSNGKHSVSYLKLSGTGGYSPGQIADHWTRQLNGNESLEVERAIEHSAIDSVQSRVGPEWTSDTENEDELVICMDGTRYVFEQLSPSGHAFLSIHECELVHEPALSALLETVLSLERQP